MPVGAVVAGQQRAQPFDQFGRQRRAGARIDQHGFRGDALGIDDVVPVEQDLEILDEPALAHLHGVAVDQMPRLDQKFGLAGADPVAALIDEQAMVWADGQFARVVQRSGGDHDRGEVAGGAHRVVAHPAHRLRAVVARQDAVADRDVLDGNLGTGGHGDSGAAAERDAGDLCEFPPCSGAVGADQGIACARRQRRQRQNMDAGDQPQIVHLDQDQRLGYAPVGRHQADRAIQMHQRAGLAGFGIRGDAERAVAQRFQRKPLAPRVQRKLIDIVGHQFAHRAHAVAEIGALGDAKGPAGIGGDALNGAVCAGHVSRPFRGGWR